MMGFGLLGGLGLFLHLRVARLSSDNHNLHFRRGSCLQLWCQGGGGPAGRSMLGSKPCRTQSPFNECGPSDDGGGGVATSGVLFGRKVLQNHHHHHHSVLGGVCATTPLFNVYILYLSNIIFIFKKLIPYILPQRKGHNAHTFFSTCYAHL